MGSEKQGRAATGWCPHALRKPRPRTTLPAPISLLSLQELGSQLLSNQHARLTNFLAPVTPPKARSTAFIELPDDTPRACGLFCPSRGE